MPATVSPESKNRSSRPENQNDSTITGPDINPNADHIASDAIAPRFDVERPIGIASANASLTASFETTGRLSSSPNARARVVLPAQGVLQRVAHPLRFGIRWRVRRVSNPVPRSGRVRLEGGEQGLEVVMGLAVLGDELERLAVGGIRGPAARRGASSRAPGRSG
jgi:hypothetical protein